MLEDTKIELEGSSNTITKLKKELELQQAYYEKQLRAAGILDEPQESIAIKQHIQDQLTQTQAYNIENAVQNREINIDKLNAKIDAIRSEKIEAEKMVGILQNELKL